MKNSENASSESGESSESSERFSRSQPEEQPPLTTDQIAHEIYFSEKAAYKLTVSAEVAFAKKEDVFKAQTWCFLPDAGSIFLCGMQLYNARIYDFQLEKYL